MKPNPEHKVQVDCEFLDNPPDLGKNFRQVTLSTILNDHTTGMYSYIHLVDCYTPADAQEASTFLLDLAHHYQNISADLLQAAAECGPWLDGSIPSQPGLVEVDNEA